jgi:hypothetical protein
MLNQGFARPTSANAILADDVQLMIAKINGEGHKRDYLPRSAATHKEQEASWECQ